MANNMSGRVDVKNLLSSFISTGVGKCPKISPDIVIDNDSDGDDVNHTSKDQTPNDPRNKAKYLNRVGSYTVRTWFAKPLSLSPMICARYGWQNTDVDMLHCVCCRAALCAKLPASSKQESYKEFCKKLKKSLVTSHEPLCPWSSNPSPEYYSMINCHNKDKVIQGFSNRINKLVKLTEERLPNINMDKCNEEVLLPNFWNKLCEIFEAKFIESDLKPNFNKLLPLAVCGWSTSQNNDVIICKYCQRHIALWNYVRVASSPNLNGHVFTKAPETPHTRKRKKSNNTVNEKRIKLSIKDSLDPVSEHRNWCPWVNIESCQTAEVLEMELNLLNDAVEKCTSGVVSVHADQDSPSKKKIVAWAEICIILAEYFGICDSTSPEKTSPFCQLRHVRNLLSMWSSPQQPPPKSSFIVDETDSSVKDPQPRKSLLSPSKSSKKTTSPKASSSLQKSPEATATVSPRMTRTAQLLTPIIAKEFSTTDITEINLDEVLSAAVGTSNTNVNTVVKKTPQNKASTSAASTAKTPAKASAASAKTTPASSVSMKTVPASSFSSKTAPAETIPKTPNNRNPNHQTVNSGAAGSTGTVSNAPTPGANTRSASANTPGHPGAMASARHVPDSPHFGANTRSANVNNPLHTGAMTTRSNSGTPIRFPNTHPPVQRGMMTRMAQKAHQQNFQRQKWRWAN
ncbi:nuclear-interacting partner of ALK [Octopus vulgaris]|uniref:Nuclear-interacting partner of ALK n=1 Tax=Octopus vulgaris TaxID=6645 RepID=A0AA36ATR3_OCTVU|nr:nuclear-interacting partner of ALK [Octopus vulgaris]